MRLPCMKLLWMWPNLLLTAIRLAHSVSPQISRLARGEMRWCRLICRSTVTVRTQRRPQGGSQFVFCLCLVAASFDKRWAVRQVEWSCSTEKSPGLLHISYVGIQPNLLDSLLWFSIWKGPYYCQFQIYICVCIFIYSFWTWISLHISHLLHLWLCLGTILVTGRQLATASGGRQLPVQCTSTTRTQKDICRGITMTTSLTLWTERLDSAQWHRKAN